MAPLNRPLALTRWRLDGQYGGGGQADYYRLPLHPGAVAMAARSAQGADLASGLQRPLGDAPALGGGAARGPRRLGVQQGQPRARMTPDTIRFAELCKPWLRRDAIMRLYTSGRDEMVDKALRAIKYNNRQADIVLAFEGDLRWPHHGGGAPASDHEQSILTSA